MSQEKKQIYLHSTAHILAQAVLELFPETKLGIGPPIKDGFYYDFDLEKKLSEKDLQKIEEKMREIINSKLPFAYQEMEEEKAINLFEKLNQPYKIELIKEITSKKVRIYTQGNFIDLCQGPHIKNTGEINAFKLLNIAGAYWRGNEKNKMLQRIYGTAWETEEELKAYLFCLEKAKKYDHRRLGKELDLFSIQEEAGVGLIYWHPKGTIIKNIIENFWKEEHQKQGYQLINTPHLAKLDLWKISGHWEFYKENMYSPTKIDEQEYIIKPMNCPGHILIYKTKMRSYKELPIRYAELASVYRYERTGVLHGMLRVRGFTQDDAHIFCMEEQIEEETTKIINLAKYMLRIFGYTKYNVYLSTRPEKYTGDILHWEKATSILEKIILKENLDYSVDQGEGVFYGPKIDIKIIDSLNREWQGPTIQFDFNLPKKFNLTYINKEDKTSSVIMLHRVVLGSLERFVGGLIEYYGGAFPTWLAPIQVVVIPITDKEKSYAKKIKELLGEKEIRVELDEENEKLGYKIRKAQLQKIPYMIIIGTKEKENNSISIRLRSGKEIKEISVEKFIFKILKEIKEKHISLME